MYNIKNDLSIEDNYKQGLLPQRNSKLFFYKDDNYSCRSNLDSFKLSSENKRILNKSNQFTFKKIPLSEFNYDLDTQKKISSWVKKLNWDFPTSSIKTLFTNHIFNYLYIWQDQKDQIVAYSICYFDEKFSHIAYVFYNPTYAHQDLPIRLALQVVIDSANLNLKYCYLGRFNPDTKLGYYKRNFPGFQYYLDNQWTSYKNINFIKI